MSNYGLVFRDAENGWTMLGEYDESGNIGTFVEIANSHLDDLGETVFAVVDVTHENGRVGLLKLHEFEMFRDEGTADYAINVVRNLLAAEDGGQGMFKMIFDEIVTELFSGTEH